MKVTLQSSAYSTRSLMTSAQRCLNLYPEINAKDAPFPTTHYATPGLVKVATAPEAGYRGLYTASSGELYAAVGNGIYLVKKDYVFQLLGSLSTYSGVVSMIDNGQHLVIVDGSASGFTVDIKTHVWSAITHPAFYGSDRIGLVDGYLIFHRPNTAQWYISQAHAVNFNANDYVAKSGFSDGLVSLAVVNHNIWLFGQQTTEIFYNVGDKFPFVRYPGVFIHHGCAAKHSIATMDNVLCWLSCDAQGQASVLRSNGMQALRISTHAIEAEFQTYPRIDDAIAYTHQLAGHLFYVLTFPSANKTWVFDLATDQWHERAWMNAQGHLHRHRASCFAFWQGQSIVGDWETGDLYQLSAETYDDASAPILRIRTFPHLLQETRLFQYQQLTAAMQTGNGDQNPHEAPEIRLRWSDTGGASWGNPIYGRLGARGQYGQLVQFQRLGMARDRVFELSWSSATQTCLSGATLEVKASIHP